MKYASPMLAQLLNFPGLFINHFCSISKINFPAELELPDTSKIFLKPTTVFILSTWHIFKTLLNTCSNISEIRSSMSQWFIFPLKQSDFQKTVFLQISFPSVQGLNHMLRCKCAQPQGGMKRLNGKALSSCSGQWYMIW